MKKRLIIILLLVGLVGLAGYRYLIGAPSRDDNQAAASLKSPSSIAASHGERSEGW